MHVFLKSAMLLWMYVCCIGQMAFADEAKTELSSEAQFRQAVTWYKVARATEMVWKPILEPQSCINRHLTIQTIQC